VLSAAYDAEMTRRLKFGKAGLKLAQGCSLITCRVIVVHMGRKK
jgi:hypothetical protein